MDAKHIGVLTYYLFAMLDLTDTFEDTKFRSSLFGQQLKAWSDLPDNPLVHGIWQTSPKQITCFWFQSLQSLCLVFQSWIKQLEYHLNQGFIEARDHTFQGHLVLDSSIPSLVPGHRETLLSALAQFDAMFALRWYQTSPHNSSWINPTPPGHFPATVYPRKPLVVNRVETNLKRQRLQDSRSNANKLVKDFVSTAPLLEMVQPLRLDIPVSTQLLE
jgi:hypothetical protein